MEVRKKGIPKVWTIKRSCTGKGNGGFGCHAKLTMTADDIFLTSRDYMDGSTDVFFTFKCTECGTLTDIADSAIPDSIQDKIIARCQPSKDDNA